MTYKERLLALHQVAVEKLKAYTEAEQTLTNTDLICDVCDPEVYRKKMELYLSYQDALSARNEFAKLINESGIDINLPYTQEVNKPQV